EPLRPRAIDTGELGRLMAVGHDRIHVERSERAVTGVVVEVVWLRAGRPSIVTEVLVLKAEGVAKLMEGMCLDAVLTAEEIELVPKVLRDARVDLEYHFDWIGLDGGLVQLLLRKGDPQVGVARTAAAPSDEVDVARQAPRALA